MNKIVAGFIQITLLLFLLGAFSSCEEFFNPDQEITITEDEAYTDWYEYRSAILGLYALQQNLVEQLVVLGELRGDLLTVTQNADADLMEIYNFNVSKSNKYASPDNFFRLIAATNRYISTLEREKPHVLDPAAQVNNYDRLYGEALCMRAWAYFNAARIYGKVPFIDQRLSTIEDIENYINSPGTYTDSLVIDYSIDGYTNDTIPEPVVVTLEKKYFDLDRVIRHFTNELETKVKAVVMVTSEEDENGVEQRYETKVDIVGVNHYLENKDYSWEVTIWSQWGYHTLLGHMYLTLGDLTKSAMHFETVVKNGTDNDQFQLDTTFAGNNWVKIIENVDRLEHIFTLWFNKGNQQTNDLQRLFEVWTPNEYMLKPTRACVHMWETQWRGSVIRYDYNVPDSTKTIHPGIPSDFYRGYGVSYLYAKGQQNYITGNEYLEMLEYKMNEEDRSVEAIMENVDTVVYKYSVMREPFDHDPNFIVYRAAGVNLYLAEIFNYLKFEDASGNVTSNTLLALKVVNDGSYYDVSTNRTQMGVRGRVGLPGFTIQNIVFEFDPFTNEVIGWRNMSGNLPAKQQRLENQIMDERARELAFEGERFYDLMRVAKRRNDKSYLASRVSEKYPAGKREYIYNLLMNEENWYIHYFD
ncbi:MAG: RagB/SusD family nutrient uptake outer membrane protein [Prolixibacteraceae bacterium]|nr:RagB/SusD family nutrient uptake outer membrane protein [Prolixibacteraceae bacterium]